MKRKHLFIALAALLAAGGFWFARSSERSDRAAFNQPGGSAGLETAAYRSQPGETPNPPPRYAPPDPVRRFKDFTPEQRVEFARKGHGPGG